MRESFMRLHISVVPDYIPTEDSAATKRRGRNIERPGDLYDWWN